MKILSQEQAIEKGYTHFIDCWSISGNDIDVIGYGSFQGMCLPIKYLKETIDFNKSNRCPTYAIIYIKQKLVYML